jgi:hypothetical protein
MNIRPESERGLSGTKGSISEWLRAPVTVTVRRWVAWAAALGVLALVLVALD